MDKRSAYLLGDPGDWYLQIDADERLRGELPSLSEVKDGMSYRMRVKWAEGSLNPWAVRLFQHRGVMQYRGAHCALFSDGQLISRRTDAEPIESAYLLHLKGQRSAERQRDKQTYYAWQHDYERAFRRQWSV